MIAGSKIKPELFCISLLSAFSLIFALVSRADVPAPPVNQQIGIQDSVFNNLEEADCRLCHENPDQFPVDPETIPDRHHLLIGHQVSDPTARPFPEGDTNGNYDCFSCHNLSWDPVTMTSQFETFRDCTFCHQQTLGESTVHHLTAPAEAGDCVHCHGDIVDNMDDGHTIPTYQPSLVTPAPSGGDGLPLNSRGEGAGACDYCHDDGTSDEGVAVETNRNTHHSTGFFAQGKCNWCHDIGEGGCTACHGQPPDGDSFPNTAGSHAAHMESSHGPGIDDCFVCHADLGETHMNGLVSFASGDDTNGDGNIDLDETDVCDVCHSNYGTYDGVNDSVIGAKTNWLEGVYIDGSLVTGREKWCAGCHDEQPSEIQGVTAPNIIGEEGAPTNYGPGYGFYKTGHGLPANRTYPASGGTISGAGLSCDYCHDVGMKHIDGVERTYDYSAVVGSDNDYQYGYRLKSINGDLPLVLPRTGTCADSGVNEAEFRLCFSCHQSGPFTDPGNYETDFRHAGTPDFNAHYYHLGIKYTCGYGPVFQSDWRTHDNDSSASCITCHNVHGSDRLSMVRDGKLINREPGLQVMYYKPGLSFDCFNYPDPRNVYLPESTGTIWAPNVGGICSTCHGSCGFDSLYLRTPFDDSPPADSQALVLHPSALDSSMNCDPAGGSWADVLDSNDGETTYVDCFSYHDAGTTVLYPAWFKVEMDNPEGLDGAIIDQLVVRAVVNVTEVNGDGGPAGSIAYMQICYDTGGVNMKCSAYHDLDGTEGYVELLIGDTVDPDGNPLDINDLNNLKVEVTLNAEECCGYADATANVTEVYAEVDYTDVSSDIDSPVISGQTPADGTVNVDTFRNLTFILSDIESGVDWRTFEIQLSGSKGYSKVYTDADFLIVSKTGSPDAYSVKVDPDVDFNGEEVITVAVQVDDYSGNSLVHSSWSFTTAPASVNKTLILHPSGVASDGGFTVTGGIWADVLDTNDGDASHVNYCCSAPGQSFYLDMDDPAGPGIAAINSITVYTYARFLAGPWPGALPYAGGVDIGYKTGTNTVWQGTAATDTTGNYNLFSSMAYSVDSDGGLLDLTDITNLQIAVKRNASGSPQLRVTEVYVEMAYSEAVSSSSSVPGLFTAASNGGVSESGISNIRICEGCHGFESLHNIQADSEPDGKIDVGYELAGYGHVGNNDDCWGCHGFSQANAPGTGPVVPTIITSDVSVITEGSDTAVTLTGTGFTNLIYGSELTSIVRLTAADSSSLELTPDAISEDSLTVTIPDTLPAGNYDLRAVKNSAGSNPVVVSVIPDVMITDVECNRKRGLLTVNGSGFGKKAEGTDAYIGLEVNGAEVEIISWADKQIKGSVSSCTKNATIKVKALFGSAASGADGKPPKPCKGKKC